MDTHLLDISTPDVLTPMETAKILHIGRSTIYQLLSEGAIRSFRIKTKILIPKLFCKTLLQNQLE